MSKRITRSYSRRGFFGGRVRYTQSYTIPDHPAKTPRTPRVVTSAPMTAEQFAEVLAQRRAEYAAHEQRIEHARQADAMKNAAALASPTRTSAWLHSWLGVALVTLATVVLLLAGSSSSLWLFVTGVLLALDWHGMISLHGWIKWRTLWATSPALAILVGVGVFMLMMLPPVVYVVQAAFMVGRMRDAKRAKLAADIRALEDALSRPVADTVADTVAR